MVKENLLVFTKYSIMYFKLILKKNPKFDSFDSFDSSI